MELTLAGQPRRQLERVVEVGVERRQLAAAEASEPPAFFGAQQDPDEDADFGGGGHAALARIGRARRTSPGGGAREPDSANAKGRQSSA